MAVGIALHGRAGMIVIIVNGRAAEQNAAGLKVECYSALEFEASYEKRSRRRVNEATAGLKHIVDGGLNGAGVQRLAIRLRTVVQNVLCNSCSGCRLEQCS